jgi:hypothetical protein
VSAGEQAPKLAKPGKVCRERCFGGRASGPDASKREVPGLASRHRTQSNVRQGVLPRIACLASALDLGLSQQKAVIRRCYAVPSKRKEGVSRPRVGFSVELQSG